MESDQAWDAFSFPFVCEQMLPNYGMENGYHSNIVGLPMPGARNGTVRMAGAVATGLSREPGKA
jgi:hypothetical protein